MDTLVAVRVAALLASGLAAAGLILGLRGRVEAALASLSSDYERDVGALLHTTFSTSSARRYLAFNLGAATGGLMLGWGVGGGIVYAVLGGVAGFVLPRWRLRAQLAARRAAFDAQLEDSLVAMSNVLRTSTSMATALEVAVDAMRPPASEEYRVVLRDHALGATMDAALVRLSDRMLSRDLDIALAAIAVGQRVGGNLAEVLDNIATTLRELKRLQGLIDSKTAEGRMQARVMTMLPAGMIAVLMVIDPAMVTPLFTEGIWLLAIILSLQIVGYVLIRRISTLEV